MANQNLSQFTEKTFVADADHTFIWDSAASISKRVSRNSWLSGTTANCRLGLADAAAPVAQTLSVQSVVAGTTNTAGAAFTIDGSQGTGTGAGGALIFRTAAAGSSGSTQNALGTALTLTTAGYVVPKSWLLQNGFSSGLEMYGSDADALSRNVSSSRRVILTGAYLVGNSGFSIGWSLNNGSGNDGANFGQADTILVRDGVGTLALRNGAGVPQTFRVYNTFLGTTANEWFEIDWKTSAGTVRLFTMHGGTGVARNIDISAGGTLYFGAGTSSPIRMYSNGVERWNISTTGHFIAAADNSYDIGASGATRPRNVYVGTNVISRPAASITPANNGEFVVEATSNTTLTFKLKGTDGTVRSGTITLA